MNRGSIEIGMHESDDVMKELKKAKIKIIEYCRQKERMHDYFLRVLEENNE